MKCLYSCVLTVMAILAFGPVSQAQSVGAPRIYKVEFRLGMFKSTGSVQPHRPCSPAAPQGVCGNGNSKGFSLDARAGDRITIKLTSNTGGAVFSIFAPDGEVLDRGSATTNWSARLPTTGSYRINVYTTKSLTPFKIRLTRTR